MSRRSIVELLAAASANLPDNISQEISPSDVRNLLQDVLDTMAPSYGGLQVGNRVQALTTTPQPLVFMTSIISLPPQWTVDPTAGTLGRSLAGVSKLNSRFTICGTVFGGTGTDVTLSLYADAAALGWIHTVACRGTTVRAGFAFTAIDPMEVDTLYTLRVSSSAAGNYRFENTLFVGENIAIRDFATGVDLPRVLANPPE
jgi:hypothetical protein